MSIYNWLSPENAQRIAGANSGKDKMMQRLRETSTPELADRVGSIYKQYPWMEPGVVLSLAKSGANDATVTNAAKIALEAKSEKVQSVAKNVGRGFRNSWLSNNILEPIGGGAKWVAEKAGKGLEWVTPDQLKTPIRYVVATWDTGKELLANAPRIVTGQQVGGEMGDKRGRAGWFASTTLGTMLSGVDSGEGYLPGEEVVKEQAKRAREYRGTINGRAFTLGRGVVDTLNLEGDFANYVSGFLDGAAALSVSRGVVRREATATAREALGYGKAIPTSGNLRSLVSATKLASGNEPAVLDISDDFVRWAQKNKYAQRLLKKLADTKSPDEVMRLLGNKVTPEDAIRIAKADTVEKQIGFLAQLANREAASKELSGYIQKMYTNPQGWVNQEALDKFTESYVLNTRAGSIGEKITDLPGTRRQLLQSHIGESKLYQWGKKWNAVVPDSNIIIRGGDRQRSAAVANLRNFLNTIGGKRINMTEREGILESLDNIQQQVNTTVKEGIESGDVVVRGGSAPEKALSILNSRIDTLRQVIADAPAGTMERPQYSSLRKTIVDSVARIDATARNFLRKTEVDVARGQLELLPDGLNSEISMLYRRAKNVPDNLDQARVMGIMDRFIVAISDTAAGGRQQAFHSKVEVEEVLEETLRMNGFNSTQIQKFMSAQRQAEDRLRAYWIDAAGDPTKTGQSMVKSMLESGLINKKTAARLAANPEAIDQISLIGPAAISDLLNHSFFLPDARDVRMYTSPFWSRALSSDSKYIRGLVKVGGSATDAADFLVSSVWKRTALMTGGYILRNVLDGQLRVALVGKNQAGMRGLLNSPLSYILWSMTGGYKLTKKLEKKFGRGFGGILPEQQWDEVKSAYLEGREAVELGDAASADLVESLGVSGYRQVADVEDAVERMKKTRDFEVVNRTQAMERHTTGVVDDLGQINSDLVMRMAVEGASGEEVIQILRLPENKRLLRDLKDLMSDGFLYVERGGERIRIPVKTHTKKLFNDAIKIWYEEAVIPRVAPYVRSGNERLINAALFDKVITPSDVGVHELMTEKQFIDEYSQYMDDGQPQLGTVVQMAGRLDGAEYDVVITKVVPHDVIDETTGEIIDQVYLYQVDSAYPGAAFGGDGMIGTPELRSAVNESGNKNLLPQWVGYNRREFDIVDEGAGIGAQAVSGMRTIVNFFFNQISGTTMRVLERYPFWRQGYYFVVKENVDMLSPSEARKIIATIEKEAAKAGVDPRRYVGAESGFGKFITRKLGVAEENLMDVLQRQADGLTPSAATATGTAEQLSAYAGTITNLNMSNLFFESAQRRNIEDALRIVYPFGAAWREVATKYMKLLAEDPFRMKKSYLVYRGGLNADPNEDGRGFFYKDPQSGQVMFQFPLSNIIGNIATSRGGGPSVDVFLEAPLKQLNVGFNGLPAMGPLAQIPAAAILKDKPQLSWLMQIVAPYGSAPNIKEGLFKAAVPGWVDKFVQAYEGNTDQMNTMYAQTWVDTMRALYVSGEYDVSTQEGEDKLLRDAKIKAQAIMGLRAASQFLGPTSGSPSFVLKDKEGVDVYADVLAQELSTLRDEDYDTAVEKFLDAHGENFMLYLASKTRTSETGKGYEPTKEFMDWSIKNKEFLDSYREVGAYFAPSTDNFSFAAFDYQIATGKREYNDPREIVRQAQYVVAAERYRQERLKYGPNPNDIAKEKLREVRKELHARYPGFPENPVFEVNRFESIFIPELKEAVNDSRTAGYEVTPYIEAYLNARDEVKARIGNVSLKQSKKAAKARAALAYYGSQLSAESKEFARLYDRHLAAEVEE